jgi:hypothetical protein
MNARQQHCVMRPHFRVALFAYPALQPFLKSTSVAI